MQRGFSIFLILLLGLGPLSAIVDGSEDAGLPACCRRDGAHHCAMAMQMAAAMTRIADPRPSFDAPLTCPNYPGPILAILSPARALAAEAPQAQTSVSRAHGILAKFEVPSSSPIRNHCGRGPPLSL
jgi:hypothetical protein